MKHLKRSNTYSNSTGSNTFNPNTLEAYSYRWWKYLGKVEGKLVFNNYRYSVSTSKHQNETRSLMSQLGIKPDLYLPLPSGINSQSLQELIVTAEEYLCQKFLEQELKQQERNERAKYRRKVKKLEDYLNNSVCFRDYEIRPKNEFGIVSKIAVHQCVDMTSIEKDVQNAIYNFHRDGFGNIVFYV